MESYNPTLDYEHKMMRFGRRTDTGSAPPTLIHLDTARQFVKAINEGSSDVYMVLATHDSYIKETRSFPAPHGTN